MEWDEQHEQDERIVESTRWVPLEDHYQAIEERAGVYIFADEGHEVKYIGKAGEGRLVKEADALPMVQEIASAKNRRKDQGATQIKALYTNSDDRAQDLETELIDIYDPPNNGVDLLKEERD